MNLVKDYYTLRVEIKDPDRPTHWDRRILDDTICVFVQEIATGECFHFCSNYGTEDYPDWHMIRTSRVQSFNVNCVEENVVCVDVETEHSIYHFVKLEELNNA